MNFRSCLRWQFFPMRVRCRGRYWKAMLRVWKNDPRVIYLEYLEARSRRRLDRYLTALQRRGISFQLPVKEAEEREGLNDQ